VYFHRGLNDAVPLNGGWYLLTSAFVVGECSSRCGTPPGARTQNLHVKDPMYC
jgi:hypothetical protein